MKSLRLDHEPDAEPALPLTAMIGVVFLMFAFFVCAQQQRRAPIQGAGAAPVASSARAGG